MIINRYNYEEYFLLYIDKELSADEASEVDAFVAEHPDLAEELTLLKQSVLRPEKHLVFTNKENLMKSTLNVDFINDSNYEEYFILYADDELTAQEKAAVEQYVNTDTERQQAFELFQQAKLQPEKLECGFKESLYKKEDERKAIPFRWSMVAAAAVLFIAGWFWLNQDADPDNGKRVAVDAGQKTSIQKRATDQQQTKPAEQVAAASDEKVAQDKVTMESETGKENTTTRKTTRNARSSMTANEVAAAKTPSQKPVKADASHELTVEKPEIKPNLAVTDIVPPRELPTEKNNQPPKDIAMASPAGVEELEDTNVINFASNNKSENVFLTNIPVDNNVPLRSFLRKASRVINKVTALKQSNRTGITVGNVEIAIQ